MSDMKSCRLCGTTTSGCDNDTFYELIDLAINATCNRRQKINYLMRCAEIVISKSSGCCAKSEYVLEAIKKAEKIFARIKELEEDPDS